MIEAIHVARGKRLLPLSFRVSRGEIVHLLGANGSGKSTLLELLSGLVQGTGKIIFDNVPLERIKSDTLARQRSYLSQQQKPAFSIGVYQYLNLSLSALPGLKAQVAAHALVEICEILGIEDKLERSTETLSGGEWQRVRLASACLQIWPSINPEGKLLLLDEPATALDIAQQSILYQMVRKMAGKGIAVIMSNHDINRTLVDADRVLLLKNGRLISQGKPKDVLNVETLDTVFGVKLRIVEIEGQRLILTK